jgi:hypothetical protein
MHKLLLLALAVILMAGCVVEPGGYYPRVRPIECGYGGCR